MPAVGTKRYAVDVCVVCLRPRFEPLPGPAVPHHGPSLRPTDSEIKTIQAVRNALDCCMMRQRPWLFIAAPLEVVPFPATQMLRTCVEKFFSSPQILGFLLLLRRRDALEVQPLLLAFEGLGFIPQR